MAGGEIEEIPMLSSTHAKSSEESVNSDKQRQSSRTWRSVSIPMRSMDSYDQENHLASQSGPSLVRRSLLTQMSAPLHYGQKSDEHPLSIHALKSRTSSTFNRENDFVSRIDNQTYDEIAANNEHLSPGKLGVCNDPKCTSYPRNNNFRPAKDRETSSRFHPKVYSQFHNIHYGDTEGWSHRSLSILGSCVPGIINPRATVVQKWNKIVMISCVLAIFLDPLFFFLGTVNKELKCVDFDWPQARIFAVVRSIIDILYLFHMLLQFRLAYVDPESRVVGAGELIGQPKKIVLHYLYGYFSIDVLAVFPFPEVWILFVGSPYYSDYLWPWMITLLCQYCVRATRFLHLVTGHSLKGFISETASSNFRLNLVVCALYSHMIGSCWYLFGFERIHRCLESACLMYKDCETVFIQCRGGNNNGSINFGIVQNWRNNITSQCFDGSWFNYGIFEEVPELSFQPSIITRCAFSFFWAFQQISTMTGDKTPSYNLLEIMFSIFIVGAGLFIFALLVGNVHSFLQALGRRSLNIQIKHIEIEQWMRRRRLPEELRRQVRQAERFHYAATDGVNEEALLKNLPENLLRDIRRHLFAFIKKVRIFALMEDQIADAICEVLKQNLYIKGSKVLYYGGDIDKMHFIVRGKMVSVDTNGNRALLSEGDTCGEELLTCRLDHYPVNEVGEKLCVSRHHFPSNRTVTCVTNVEAFSLRLTDLEEVATLFPGFFRSSRVQRAIRYESPYWRVLAAIQIQITWRYRKKRLSRGKTSNPGTSRASS